MTFYITTPIYYVNDVPHLGHAYTTIVADALARFHRMRGEDTRFLTGTDEHGQKVEETATKKGLTPQQLVDQVAPRFDETWKTLGIEGYRFIRTTDDKHKRVVATLWRAIKKKNPDDLYLASYQGWYCVGCEAFYTESQLVKDGDQWLCSVHKKPVNWIDKERSWFFKLSRYAEPLLEHIAKNPDFIRPEAYRNEIVAFLKSGLKDLSVSRTSFAWGIPVPEDDTEGMKHVIYVWMDALTNYLSDLCPESGEIGGPDVAKYWSEAIHVIGKDILRFHTVYWPAFLMSAGLPLPKSIFAHGWWTVRGEKISKSMPATRIDPVKLADALAVGPLGRPIGIDAMRYYLLREVPLGFDGDFTFESLFGRFNAELANDLGNLVNRSLTLMAKSNLHPAYDMAQSEVDKHASFAKVANDAIVAATAEYEAMAPSKALEAIWKLVREANRYVDLNQPWALAKDPSKAIELAHVFHNLANAIGVIGGLVSPILPTTGRLLRQWVGLTGADEVAWPTSSDMLKVVGNVSKDPKPMYPRLDEAAQTKILTQIVPGDIAGAAASAPAPATPATQKPTAKGGDAKAGEPAKAADGAPGTITYDDFAKLDLRVGKVLSAVAVPKKDKLLHLQVDLGEGKPRSIIAGLALSYKPEALVGKNVIVVANLAPRKMAGLVSEGMILASGEGDSELGVSALDRDAAPGTRVR
ncbi:MAG TPA: methionine--tRNA ligase [Kofleriaceae bacterium]|nr:methionine--tRNA ligase [Kofleriaceae bacterium]